MRTVTWIPGEYPEMDNLFEALRLKQYHNHTDALWSNYTKEHFVECEALTIHFDDDEQPELCSSILARNCWPKNVYRIMNRSWKVQQKRKFTLVRSLSNCSGETLKNQIKWLSERKDTHLAFVSRQIVYDGDNFDKWAISNLKKFGMEFSTNKFRYLTCSNEDDDACWQKIYYTGNHELLNSWKYKTI